MPLPLKPGYNFNYDRKVREPFYEMSAAEQYTDFYGISYMISGERMIYSPTFTTITQAYDMVFIPKYVYRRTTYVSNAPYERILLKFNDKMIDDLIDTIGRDTYEELCSEHVIRFKKSAHPKILSIMNEIAQEWNHYNKYSELIIKGLLNKLIITVLRERIVSGINIMNMEKQHAYLAEAIKYLRMHLRDNPSLNETAAYVNISPSYLSKIFTTQLHTPFSSFLQNEKIGYACNLLLNTTLNMTEITFETGFSSNSYFSDCFKRNMGMSPLQFRKAKSQSNISN